MNTILRTSTTATKSIIIVNMLTKMAWARWTTTSLAINTRNHLEEITTQRIAGRSTRQMAAPFSASIAINAIFLIQLCGCTLAISMVVSTTHRENVVGPEDQALSIEMVGISSKVSRNEIFLHNLSAQADQSTLLMVLRRYLSRFFRISCTRKRILIVALDPISLN